MRRRNGCDTPHPKGRGQRTLLGGELCSCPRRRLPANVRAWLGVHWAGRGGLTHEESMRASPLLVEALCFIRDTNERIQLAHIEATKRRAEQERDGNRTR